MNKAAQAYFQTKVSTTDQGQLLLLLYDGALKFLQQAREKMLAKDYATKGILISRVIDIINELSGSLNMDKGGTLAENLNNLYFLCTTRLLQANLKMDVNQLDSVVGVLSGLRGAYAQIIDKPEAKQAAAQIASKMRVDASMTQRAAPITAQLAAPAAIGQIQARQAYGGAPVAAPSGAPAPPPLPSAVEFAQSAPALQPAPSPAAPAAPAPAAAPFQTVLQQTSAPESVSPAAGPQASTIPVMPQAAPQTTPRPATPAGFGKRLAAYGKMTQGN